MGFFSDLLQGIPVNAVLKERLALAEQKCDTIEAENKGLKEKLMALATENESLKKELEGFRYSTNRPTLHWGCYKIEGEQGLLCPACYDTKKVKAQTTRLNSKQRKCSVCHTVLGAG